jgi:hypothetical protein
VNLVDFARFVAPANIRRGPSFLRYPDVVGRRVWTTEEWSRSCLALRR